MSRSLCLGETLRVWPAAGGEPQNLAVGSAWCRTQYSGEPPGQLGRHDSELDEAFGGGDDRILAWPWSPSEHALGLRAAAMAGVVEQRQQRPHARIEQPDKAHEPVRQLACRHLL